MRSWFRPFTGRQAPDRIVVGVDGSPNSIDAVVWAVRQASTTGANVEAVMCWHYPPSNGMEISVLDADWAVGAGAALKPDLEQVPRAVQVRIPPTIAFGRATEILVARSMKPSHSWSARGPRFSGRGATRLGQPTCHHPRALPCGGGQAQRDERSEAVVPAAQLGGQHCNLSTPGEAQLRQHPRHVVLDGFLGEKHPARDLPIGESLADEFQDNAFL